MKRPCFIDIEMTILRETERKFCFYKICLDGECVRDPDPTQKKLKRPKPLTRDEQCKKYTGHGAYAVSLIYSWTQNSFVKTRTFFNFSSRRVVIKITLETAKSSYALKKLLRKKLHIFLLGSHQWKELSAVLERYCFLFLFSFFLSMKNETYICNGGKNALFQICRSGECIINPKILKGKVPAPRTKSREEQCQKLHPAYHSYRVYIVFTFLHFFEKSSFFNSFGF